MMPILGILLTFLLTIVIGSKVTQARQQDSWIAQQRFSGQEKEYFELKQLCDEIASSTDIRIYAMHRLALQLRARARHSKFDETAIQEYKEAVKSWNQNLSSYYTRLSQLEKSKYRYRLESLLHVPLKKQGDALDRAILESRRELSAAAAAQVIKELNKITSAAMNFNGSLLHEVHEFRSKIYFPKRLVFSRTTASKFSTWQLIKAIFIVDVNRISIVRSPLDS